MKPDESVWWLNYICFLARKWDTFVEYNGDEITTSDDGLWQPVTDDRIKAVMPLAPGVSWFYGERGLASADRPAFMICGTEDKLIDYQTECVYTYEHLGTTERFLVSFIGKKHMMVENSEQAARKNHFATAFFGYYLQDREEYATYFSEEFVK